MKREADKLGTTLLMMAVAVLMGHQLLWGSVTGSISGVVRDTSGAVIPGAEVVAVLVQREMESRRFSIARVPPLRGGDFQGMGKSIESDEEEEEGG